MPVSSVSSSSIVRSNARPSCATELTLLTKFESFLSPRSWRITGFQLVWVPDKNTSADHCHSTSLNCVFDETDEIMGRDKSENLSARQFAGRGAADYVKSGPAISRLS